MGKPMVPNHDPDRLSRILDAKYRTIGIDLQSIESQVQERKRKEEAEKQRDIAFARASNYYASAVGEAQQQAEAMARTAGRELNVFRHISQARATTREWDINRPDAKKIDIPARIGDDDGRLGVSSIQKFDGEDLSAGDRATAQIAQSRGWYQQQMAENAARRAAEKREEAVVGATLRMHDALQTDIARQEAAIRRELAQLTNAANGTMLEQQRLRALRAREDELRANLAEMTATLRSARMTEDPAQAASALSDTRVRVDHWKGFSPSQVRGVLDGQLAQVAANQAARDAARLAELSWNRQQQDVLKAFSEAVRGAEDFRRQQAVAAAANLQRQAADKAARDREVNEMYANKITADFFTQFGTSHR